jgi:hypothetical protein
MRQKNAFHSCGRPVDVEVMFHDPFVLVYFEPPVGKPLDDDGRLFFPPKLFVLVYNGEHGELVSQRISFEAAKVLHPETMESICKDLEFLRGRSSPPTEKQEAAKTDDLTYRTWRGPPSVAVA